MPFTRDPLKRLSKDEVKELTALETAIAKLNFRLGGKLCWCGKASFDDEWCSECKPIA
jgi:hypothetical protein